MENVGTWIEAILHRSATSMFQVQRLCFYGGEAIANFGVGN